MDVTAIVQMPDIVYGRIITPKELISNSEKLQHRLSVQKPKFYYQTETFLSVKSIQYLVNTHYFVLNAACVLININAALPLLFANLFA